MTRARRLRWQRKTSKAMARPTISPAKAVPMRMPGEVGLGHAEETGARAFGLTVTRPAATAREKP